MRTLVTLKTASRLVPPDTVVVQWQEPELGLTLWKGRLAYVRRALKLLWAARRYDRVVVVTGGAELFVLAALLPRSKKLVAADWLMPRSTRLEQSRLLRRVRFLVREFELTRRAVQEQQDARLRTPEVLVVLLGERGA